MFRRPQGLSVSSSEIELAASDLVNESESAWVRPLVMRVGVGGNVLRIALLRNWNGKEREICRIKNISYWKNRPRTLYIEMDAELINTKSNQMKMGQTEEQKQRDELSDYTYVVRRISIRFRWFRGRRWGFFGRQIIWLKGGCRRFGHCGERGSRRWRWRDHIFGNGFARRHHSDIISNLNLNLMRPIPIRNRIVFVLMHVVYFFRRAIRWQRSRCAVFAQRWCIAEEFFGRHLHGARWMLAIRIVAVNEFYIV